MSRPRGFDAFCGAGGCTKGYQRVGFEMWGCDIKPQPRYCGEQFIQGDALELLADPEFMAQFDFAHASPPCQSYIRGGLSSKDGRHPDLLPETRELLEATGLPWVIENVPGAPMCPHAVICGSMFRLEVRRHRWFEFSWGEPLLTPPCDHSYAIAGVYGNPHGQAGAWPGMLPSNHETWSRAMGIDWMTTSELADAIPPAYTELIGHQLMQRVKARVA